MVALNKALLSPQMKQNNYLSELLPYSTTLYIRPNLSRHAEPPLTNITNARNTMALSIAQPRELRNHQTPANLSSDHKLSTNTKANTPSHYA